MKIRLLLFAVLRDIVGADEREIELPEGATAADLWQRLRSDHQELSRYETPPMTAINQEYAAPTAALRTGDEVAFIPPVSGG